MASVLIRIALRYFAAMLVTHGLIAPEMSDMLSYDPDISAAIEIALGAAVAGAAEGWYYLAHRFGWAK